MQIALRNMRSNVMLKSSIPNPIALGFAGVTLLFGVLLIIAGVQTPNAVAQKPHAAYFGVTDADLDMNDDAATRSNADKKTSAVTENESEEFIDYTWVFPSEPGADGRTLMRLGVRSRD
jgi:hypothetical protein